MFTGGTRFRVKATGPILAIVLAACGGGSSVPASSQATTPAQPSPYSVTAARQAQSELRNGFVAAKVYFTDGDTYSGFDAGAAAALEIEPAVTFVGDEPASTGVVSINLARTDQIVMSTLSGDGEPFCIGEDLSTGTTTFGSVDGVGASDASACSGDSWLSSP